MLFTPSQRGAAEAFRRLVYCNPFLPERVSCEREILGDDAGALDSTWNVIHDMEGGRRNLTHSVSGPRRLPPPRREVGQRRRRDR